MNIISILYGILCINIVKAVIIQKSKNTVIVENDNVSLLCKSDKYNIIWNVTYSDTNKNYMIYNGNNFVHNFDHSYTINKTNNTVLLGLKSSKIEFAGTYKCSDADERTDIELVIIKPLSNIVLPAVLYNLSNVADLILYNLSSATNSTTARGGALCGTVLYGGFIEPIISFIKINGALAVLGKPYGECCTSAAGSIIKSNNLNIYNGIQSCINYSNIKCLANTKFLYRINFNETYDVWQKLLLVSNVSTFNENYLMTVSFENISLADEYPIMLEICNAAILLPAKQNTTHVTIGVAIGIVKLEIIIIVISIFIIIFIVIAFIHIFYKLRKYRSYNTYPAVQRDMPL